MDRKAFLVTTGSYSDYHVVAVFDDESLAQAAMEELNRRKRSYDDDHIVETVEMNPSLESGEYAPDGLCVFKVYMDREGNTVHDGLERVSADTMAAFVSESENQFVAAWDDFMGIRVIARDITHAVKIANEKRAQWLAHGKAWGQC